jgi:hypothetical protein
VFITTYKKTNTKDNSDGVQITLMQHSSEWMGEWSLFNSYEDYIDDIMVSMLSSNALVQGFELQSDPTEHYQSIVSFDTLKTKWLYHHQ